MYSAEQLFVLRVDELKQILANPTERGLLAASGLLRRLITDQNCLLHQVNRKIREKVWFIVNDLTARPNPDHPAAKGAVFSQVASGIAPDPMFPQLPQRRLNLDNFLKMEVLFYSGHYLTVIDIISYVANYAGEIHKSEPDSPEDKALEAAAINIRVGDMPSVLQNFTGIAKVVIAALEPIYAKLRA
jgi:hypothetical protein